MKKESLQAVKEAYKIESECIATMLDYLDEEAMTDPMIVPTGTKHMGTDLFNTMNADVFAEFNKAVLTVESGVSAVMVKNITMLNAKGVNVELEYRRRVQTLDISGQTCAFGVKGVAYTETDSFTPLREYSTDDVIINAWSLEQFNGAEGITAFGAYARKDAPVSKVVNDDFYGDPLVRISSGNGLFLFRLGGPNRLQIGFKKDCLPELIGAYDAARNMLIIRKTSIEDGVYVNIADNDQKNGAYSTEDVYSIFNGSQELNFFELETIAPMTVRNGKLIRSVLNSRTFIYRGGAQQLGALLEKEYQLNSKEIIK